MAGKVITDFIRMQLFRKGGAIANDKAVQFSANALEKRLLNLGIDPNSINNQTQLKQLLAYVKQMEDSAFNQQFSGIMKNMNLFKKEGDVVPFKQKRNFKEEIEAMKKSGDIVDEKDMVVSEKITDREMFKNSNLNKPTEEITEDTGEGFIDFVRRTDPKSADKLQKVEDEIKAAIEAGNKRAVENLKKKNKKKKEDDPEFYTGGMVDVEPSLSDIGHGSDALMARTRLMSPGSQSTTSTGLNYLLAEDNDNIRVPFSVGGDAGRRAFLKLMAALTGGVAAVKSGIIGLGEGTAKKTIPSLIKTPNAPGKPEWFDALVTRIIKEGDDVTKTMSTKERQNIYRKKIDDETEVTVTQDLDEGVTRIDIDDSVRNVTGFDDPPTVSLQVTDEIVEEGGARIKPQFKATENDYRNYATDPDGGYETEFVENTVENTKDLTSDLTKIKSFATKKKETMKEFIESKKRKDNVKYAEENPSAYAADRGPDYDPTDFIDDMADDFADGGRIGFSAGSLARLGITGSSRRFLEKVFGKESFERMIENDPDLHRGMLEVVEMFRKKDKEGLKMYMQKFLPHMDDATVEDFIVGGGGTEGIQGQLIRLGSGRDYAGKVEMMKKADNMRKLDALDVDKMKPNAEGGLITMLGE